MIRKGIKDRKVVFVLCAFLVYTLGRLVFDMDFRDTYALAGMFVVLAMAIGISESGQTRSFEPSDEQSLILDTAETLTEKGYDFEEVVRIGEMAIGARRKDPTPPPSGDRVIPNGPDNSLVCWVILLILIPSMARASQEYECYMESPWWKGLYDLALYDANPEDRGLAIGELAKFRCQPIDIDGNGSLGPNPNCNPPPDCSFDPSPRVEEDRPPTIGPRVETDPELVTVPAIVEAPPSQTVILPRINIVDPFRPPTFRTNINESGDFFCTCARSEMAVGDEMACYVQGQISGPISWSTSGPIQPDDVMDDRAISIKALGPGTGNLIFRERVCATVYINDRTPSLQDQALQMAAEQATALAIERERLRRPSFWTSPAAITLYGILGSLVTYLATRDDMESGPVAVLR